MSAPPAIAIVGLGGVFPGAADLDEFWANIRDAQVAAQDFPEGLGTALPGICSVDELSLLDELDELELDPAVLAELDPGLWLLLHAARQAVLSARFERLDLDRVGVIIGNNVLPSESTVALSEELLGAFFESQVLAESRGERALRPPGTHPLNRYAAGLPAGILAKALGLGGGALSLDAPGASSLVALKLACDELVAGRRDAMLAGGLSRSDRAFQLMAYSQLGMLSESGRCAPFSCGADGLVLGDGAGVFVLKRLEDAIEDEDEILGIIRAIGLSQSRSKGLLEPDDQSPLRALRAAYELAGWSPSSVQLIEGQGSGDLACDAAELASLAELWGSGDWEPGSCVVGSVKGNIGDLQAAAGAASLAKVLLALRNESLPPSAHFGAPGDATRLAGTPFSVLSEARPWKSGEEPRRAAVSAAGLGGLWAHLLVEEWGGGELEESAGPVCREAIAVVGLGAAAGLAQDLSGVRAKLFGESEPRLSPARWWGLEEAPEFLGEGLSRVGRRGLVGIGELTVAAERFGIPPEELQAMLPQQLLMLMVAAEALEGAGWQAGERPRAGVFIGLSLDLGTTQFAGRWSLDKRVREWNERLGLELDEASLKSWTEELREVFGPALTASRSLGAMGGLLATRIAREFRLGGLALSVSSEETSGLRALELALRALQRGEIDEALVGAVELSTELRAVFGADGLRPYSRSGQVLPFDRRADGSIPGDGACALVLKRLSDAERDGDEIHAVICGIGVASGGGCEDAAPSALAYRSALEQAYEDAELEPTRVGLVEAHGSGVPAEDLVETAVLGRFFGSHLPKASRAISSAKTALGHSGAAAGLMSLLKAVLSLREGLWSPLLLGRGARGGEPRDLGPGLLRPLGAQPWLRNRRDGPRCAGVSAMSAVGGCVHVVLQEFQAPGAALRVPTEPLLGGDREALFVVEADDPRELARGLAKLRQEILGASCDVVALARHRFQSVGLQPQRRLGVSLVARSMRELRVQILAADAALAESPGLSMPGSLAERRAVADRVFFEPEPLRPNGLAFVYPGLGRHFPGMARSLAARWPELARSLDWETPSLHDQLRPGLLWNEPERLGMDEDCEGLILGQLSLGSLLSDLLAMFKLHPSAAIGYGEGEAAGLLASRTWRGRDELRRRIQDSCLFRNELAGDFEALRVAWDLGPEEEPAWQVGFIDQPASRIRGALSGRKRVYLLMVNAPDECLVGGDPEFVAALVDDLDARYEALGAVPFLGCEPVQAQAEAYRQLYQLETKAPEGLSFYSGAWGRAYRPDEESAADALLALASAPGDFSALIEAAYGEGQRAFLELGPGRGCQGMIARILGDRPHWSRSLCVSDMDSQSSLLRCLGQLIAHRVPMDLAPLYGRVLVPEIPRDEDSSEGQERPLAARLQVGAAAFPLPPALRLRAREARSAEADISRRGKVFHEPVDGSQLAPPESADWGDVETWIDVEGEDEDTTVNRRRRALGGGVSGAACDPLAAAGRVAATGSGLLASAAAGAAAHGSFLALSKALQENLESLIRLQAELLLASGGKGEPQRAQSENSRRTVPLDRSRLSPADDPENSRRTVPLDRSRLSPADDPENSRRTVPLDRSRLSPADDPENSRRTVPLDRSRLSPES